MSKRLMILCVMIIGFLNIHAQEIITGTVLNSKNEPVPGVRVEVVGRSEYTTTDIDGRFRFDLPVAVKKLRFQYVGQKPIERNVKPDMVVKIGNGWQGKDSGYRGFFDYDIGFGSGGKMNIYLPTHSFTEIGKSSFMMGISTTHGYQINPMFYVGVGLGVSILSLYVNQTDDYGTSGNQRFYGFAFPFYIDGRWDYDIKSRLTPFIDLKIGYQRILGYDDFDDYYWNNFEFGASHTSSFLLMPTIGLRRAIGAKRAFTIGLTYNIFVKRSFTVCTYEDIHLPNGEVINTTASPTRITSTGGVALLTVGFDF